MIIGIDLDNTIIEYDCIFAKYAIDRGYPAELEKTKSAIRSYYLKEGKEESFTEMQAEVYGLGILNAECAEGLNEFIFHLHNYGHKLIVISHKTEFPYKGPQHNLRKAARKWLSKQEFVGIGLPIEKNQIFFESTKEKKIERINQSRCDVFIDDLIEILQMLPTNISRILYSPSGTTNAWNSSKTIVSWSKAYKVIRSARP